MSLSTATELRSLSSEQGGYRLSRLRYLRAKLLDDILGDISVSDNDLARLLTRQHIAASLPIDSDSAEDSGDCPVDPHGPFDNSSIHDFQLTEANQDRLLSEIEAKISAISNFSQGSTRSTQSEDICNLPQSIVELLEDIASSKTQLEAASSDIRELVTRTNELHQELQSELLGALSSIPPLLNEKRAASNDLLSATIEASLVKLSLMRTRSHRSLYGFTSSSNTNATMSNALSTAYEKLKDEENDLRDEKHALEVQLEEYRHLMQLVDGNGSSGFGQIVQDWIRVQKETEECRKDLRRLGWTGD